MENVAPFAGAWIEIYKKSVVRGGALSSLPSRERGLKLLTRFFFRNR